MDQPSLISGLAAGIAAALAGFERYRSIKASDREKTALVDAATSKQQSTVHAEILAGKDALIALARETADAQKARYDSEHKEYTDYRTATHAHATEANTLVLRLTEENGLLKAKTDMTPVFQFQQDQTQTNKLIIETLNRIIERLDKHEQ